MTIREGKIAQKLRILADFNVFYSMLRHWKLWHVSFFFYVLLWKWRKCHLIWETEPCNVIFMYCVRLRHINVMCLTLCWCHWCVSCNFVKCYTSFRTVEVTATCLHALNQWNAIKLRHFYVFIETINVNITSIATRIFLQLDIISHRNTLRLFDTQILSACSGLWCTIFQKLRF